MFASETAERSAIAGDPAWERLRRELDLWTESDRPATFWWRDDDAVAVTPALEKLLEIQREFTVPLALAVIPDRLEPGLNLRLAGSKGVVILQHGYCHRNYAPKSGEGAWECGDHRPFEQVGAELIAGRIRLAEEFGERFLPVLVPPWNRISERVVQGLPALGFVGFTAFRARAQAEPLPGLVQVNTHCDPIKWKEGARFAGTGRALDDLIGHLQARRMGTADPGEPTGLLTHHLALDASAWLFAAELLRRTCAHPRALWRDPRELFRQ